MDASPKERTPTSIMKKLVDVSVEKLREGVNLVDVEQYLIRMGAQADVAKALLKKAIDSIDTCDHLLSLDVCLAKADEARAQGDLQKELQCRLAIYRHKKETERYPALRLQNLYFLISCFLLNPLENDNHKLLKEIMASVQDIPCTYTEIEEELPVAQCFERFYRTLFSAVDVDTVFGPPFEAKPWESMEFFDSYGAPISVQSLQEHIKENQVEVIFCAGTSEEYALRYIEDYVASMVVLNM